MCLALRALDRLEGQIDDAAAALKACSELDDRHGQAGERTYHAIYVEFDKVSPMHPLTER